MDSRLCPPAARTRRRSGRRRIRACSSSTGGARSPRRCGGTPRAPPAPASSLRRARTCNASTRRVRHDVRTREGASEEASEGGRGRWRGADRRSSGVLAHKARSYEHICTGCVRTTLASRARVRGCGSCAGVGARLVRGGLCGVRKGGRAPARKPRKPWPKLCESCFVRKFVPMWRSPLSISVGPRPQSGSSSVSLRCCSQPPSEKPRCLLSRASEEVEGLVSSVALDDSTSAVGTSGCGPVVLCPKRLRRSKLSHMPAMAVLF